MQSSPRKLRCSAINEPSRAVTFCSSAESSGGAGVFGSSAALISFLFVVTAEKVGAGLEPILRHQQIGLVPERAAARVARDLDLAAHHDRLLGAGLLAQPAEHAARHVDVENFG